METFPDYDYVIDLPPTSPLRTASDIDNSIEMCIQQNGESLVSVSKTKKSPYWMYTIKDDRLTPFLDESRQTTTTRRQELPDTYAPNGAIYMATRDHLFSSPNYHGEGTIPYIMPEERSWDIDTPFDLKVCECLVTH